MDTKEMGELLSWPITGHSEDLPPTTYFIGQIKTCRSEYEANLLLKSNNWKLLNAKIEKLKVPAGKEKIGTVIQGAWDHIKYGKYEVTYKEKMEVCFVLQRIK